MTYAPFSYLDADFLTDKKICADFSMLLMKHSYVCIANTLTREPRFRQHGDIISSIRVRLLDRQANALLLSRAEADAWPGLRDGIQRTPLHRSNNGPLWRINLHLSEWPGILKMDFERPPGNDFDLL